MFRASRHLAWSPPCWSSSCSTSWRAASWAPRSLSSAPISACRTARSVRSSPSPRSWGTSSRCRSASSPTAAIAAVSSSRAGWPSRRPSPPWPGRRPMPSCSPPSSSTTRRPAPSWGSRRRSSSTPTRHVARRSWPAGPWRDRSASWPARCSTPPSRPSAAAGASPSRSWRCSSRWVSPRSPRSPIAEAPLTDGVPGPGWRDLVAAARRAIRAGRRGAPPALRSAR